MSVLPESQPLAHRARYLRDLLIELVARELKIRYKRSVLGIAWSFVLPIGQLLVFSFVFQRVLPLDVPNYPSFVFSGLLTWGWFSTSLLAATTAITDNRELIRRPGFPVVVLPIVSVASNLIHFVLALPILVGFITIFVGPPPPTILLLPVVVVVQFFLLVGLGYLVATFQVTFRDTQHLLAIALQLMFYLTPIFYSQRSVPSRFEPLYRLNPMAHIVQAYRAMLLTDVDFNGRALLWLAVLATIAVWIGLRVFTRASYAFAEEL